MTEAAAGTTEHLERLFERIDRTPWGPDERALVAEAVQLATDSGDTELEYRARMRQTSSSNMAGNTEVLLSSFAWCLATHDSDPVRFPADVGGGNDLMWHFKWMAGVLCNSPHFSSTQIAAVLDDMQEHYQRAGLGDSGVLMARFSSSFGAGRLDEAETLRIQLEATPRDDYSHCEACTRSQFAEYAVRVGRDAEAIRLVEEMVDGGLSCAEEPEYALAQVLLPYLRAGRFDDAKAAHLRSYRLSKADPDHLGTVAANIVFTAVTGNAARALAMLERHIGWLAHDGLNENGHCSALSAFALALDAVVAAGHGDTAIRGADAPALSAFFGPHEGTWRADELAAASWRAADALGAAFDARNGNTSYADRLAALRELRETRYDLPLRSDAFAATPIDLPADADSRFARAEALADFGDAVGSLELARALLAEGGVDAERAARLHAITVGALVALEDLPGASAALPARIDAVAAAGEPAQAEVERQLGLLVFGAVERSRIDELEAAAQREDLPLVTRADLYVALGGVGVEIDDLEAAVCLLTQAAEWLDEAGRHDRASAIWSIVAGFVASTDAPASEAIVTDRLTNHDASIGARIRLLRLDALAKGRAQDFAAGAAQADEALRLAATIGLRDGLADLNGVAAQLHRDAGDLPASVARYRLAAQHAEREGSPHTLNLRYQLGVSMVRAGDAAEAVEVFSDLLDAEASAGVAPASRAQTAASLAQAFDADAQPGNAVGAWEHAEELFTRAGDRLGRGQALLNQGLILGRHGQHDAAIDTLEQAVAAARELPAEPELLLRSVHLLGQATAAAGRDDALAHLDEAALLAEAAGDAWSVADIGDSRARVWAQRDDIDRAVAEALQAADAFTSLGDPATAAGSELFAARALIGAGRRADSVPAYRAAIEHTDDATLRQIAAIEVGDVLASLGRHAEADDVRALADS